MHTYLGTVIALVAISSIAQVLILKKYNLVDIRVIVSIPTASIGLSLMLPLLLGLFLNASMFFSPALAAFLVLASAFVLYIKLWNKPNWPEKFLKVTLVFTVK
jgi:hypothetical protein